MPEDDKKIYATALVQASHDSEPKEMVLLFCGDGLYAWHMRSDIRYRTFMNGSSVGAAINNLAEQNWYRIDISLERKKGHPERSVLVSPSSHVEPAPLVVVGQGTSRKEWPA